MELDITEFKQRLATVQKRGDAQNIIAFFYDEIRQAEHMKQGLMEEMNEQNREFLVKASDNIDTYIFKVRQMEKDLQLPGVPDIQQDILQDNLHGKIIDKIEEVETLRKKYGRRSI